MAGLDTDNRDRWTVSMEPYAVSDFKALKLGENAIGIVDITSKEVLEPGVAVESAASLPDLDEPGPDVVGGGVDGNGASGENNRLWDELITGQGRMISP